MKNGKMVPGVPLNISTQSISPFGANLPKQLKSKKKRKGGLKRKSKIKIKKFKPKKKVKK